MIYRMCNGLIAISAKAYLESVSVCTRFEDTCADPLQHKHVHSHLLPQLISLWNT